MLKSKITNAITLGCDRHWSWKIYLRCLKQTFQGYNRNVLGELKSQTRKEKMINQERRLNRGKEKTKRSKEEAKNKSMVSFPFKIIFQKKKKTSINFIFSFITNNEPIIAIVSLLISTFIGIKRKFKFKGHNLFI